MSNRQPDLQQAAADLPAKTGVYLISDRNGTVIYVGKALNLRNRVRSYFSGRTRDLKTQALAGRAAALDYILTGNERDALLLENNLIKKHKPRYNILLKDSKQYPFLCVTTHEDFPRLIKTRVKQHNRDTYFGPFPNVGIITHSMKLLHRLFPIRQCRKKLEAGKSNGTVCIYYHIKKCPGPCEQRISRDDYRKIIESALHYLRGDIDELRSRLQIRMKEHAAQLEFEQAAVLRDQLQAIEHTAQSQLIHQGDTTGENANMDVIQLAENSGLAALAVMQFRDGKLQGQRLFLERHADEKPDLFLQFLRGWALDAESVAPLIVLGEIPEDGSAVKTLFPESRILSASSPSLTRLMKRALLLAGENARQALDDEIRVELYRRGLAELQTLLGMERLPLRIEGYDIANLGAEDIVAGMVSFFEGRPDKKNYRKFIITSTAGQDDFGSIQEAVGRRYQRLLNEEKPLPDLILIDGGKGQLNAAKQVLDALGLEKQPVAALAKKEELVYLPDRPEPLRIAHHRFPLRILQAVRDEVHRYVNSFHAKRRSAGRIRTRLEEIPGVGPATRQKLLKRFGSIEGLRRAGPGEIQQTVGSAKTAEAVSRWLAENKN